ncbi:GNAT family N-acetyltransferase [Herbiconiux flava]|uniref:GNAT superfamily N-acetyltransferase n=1 Tax=Herbiconiux flava TaxID=881268 RepID=A0A852SP09_9MICO|nr:GNAT family N-acetyltransferase [Herbiconiux flava]NYD70530.1 GNAT superfamily N-acetyltransferase [Herbiconiux flava]GLK17283.1 GNAT family N-acetyltransferase [Herbiconiux flava]
MTNDSGALSIELLPPEAADDEALVGRLVAIVNAAYAVGEAGMWVAGTSRVGAEEMRGLIRASEIVVARVGERPTGCVRVHRLDETTWGFGMLAAARDAHGRGIGRALVAAAEEVARSAGAAEMQLELLVPSVGVQESKVRLAAWYARAGYRRTASKPMAEDYPELADSLAAPCDYQIWRKPLD